MAFLSGKGHGKNHLGGNAAKPLCLFAQFIRLSWTYRKRALDKGLGCLASCPLPPGSLILREAPQLSVQLDLAGPGVFAEIIKAFMVMGPGEQEEYLTLSNKYCQEEERSAMIYSR